MKTDLHLHSTASDGVLSPSALAHAAIDSGMDIIALTDHDTMKGMDECAKVCMSAGIRFIPGTEISAGADGGVHVLGYGADPSRMEGQMNAFFLDRLGRMEKMVAMMQGAGMDISMDDVYAFAGSAPLCRPHLAMALVKKGYATSVKNAFNKYIGAGRPFLADKRTPAFADAADIIHAAGGVVVIAHPVLIKTPRRMLTQYLSALIDKGADGIEAWHTAHTASDAAELEAFARAHSLIVTGGSDFHGEGRDAEIGGGQKGRTGAERDIDMLLARMGNN